MQTKLHRIYLLQMISTIEYQGLSIKVNLHDPIDISMPLEANASRASAWYVPPVSIEPVRAESFVGDVNQGGSVNFRNITFNPHGNGTHTECVGHISKEWRSVNKLLNQYFFMSRLISVEPQSLENGDQVISLGQVKEACGDLSDVDAIVIRTLPNDESKLTRQYSNTNPPYISADAINYLTESGIHHFLIDTPSVDREIDEGILAAHHQFWNYPENTESTRTITEMVYVPSSVSDGLYLLNLQVAPFENDASPSRPLLFKIL